ncbi:MAG: heme-binding protein [Myxococcota bacterium]|nr:heme-binding protein [Myxococcota bacterium]
MRNVPTLELADADVAIAAMRDALSREPKPAVIAVADAQGELLALARLDGAPASSITIARNKAWTAATQGTPTRAIGARLRSADEAFDIAYYGDARACGWAGGLPVRDRDGHVVGAVAVSGLPELDDERIAAVGLAAIEQRLGISPARERA